MPSYRVPENLSFCLIEQAAIFLDLSHDRYFMLSEDMAQAFERLRRGTASPAETTQLVEAGLVVSSPGALAISPAPAHVPTRSLVEEAEPRRAGIGALPLRIGAELLRVRRSLRNGGLERLVASLRECRTCVSPGKGGSRATIDLALSWRAARALVPLAGNCLSDSLCLARFLARQDCHPRLVLGVKLNPFAAHCWVQTDELILNDAVDSARDFSPVLVV